MGEYDDIINLPHPEPKRHPRMSMYGRAAQFAPFAALSGYDDAIKTTKSPVQDQQTEEDDDANM